MLIKSYGLLLLLIVRNSICLPVNDDDWDLNDEESADCEMSEYGCCPDGVTPSKGYLTGGCIDFSCEQTEFGCCEDLVSPAKNLLKEGCPVDCTDSYYGCCPDQMQTARGTGFAGCDLTLASITETVQQIPTTTPITMQLNKTQIDDGSSAVCSLIADGGPCYNYEIKWAYNTMSGRCEQFWWGGCGGNANRFESQESCESRCVSPPGLAVCYLKPVSPVNGECKEENIRFYYDAESEMCKEFLYSGCFGNSNNYRTLSECEKKCRFQILVEQCSLPAKRGTCQENQLKWYFDTSSSICKTFMYGGCEANKNNYPNENVCIATCVKPRQEEVCLLPTLSGNCNETYEKWSYDVKAGVCKSFIYSGCNGNLNRFDTKKACEYTCQGLKVHGTQAPIEICNQPKVPGNCNQTIKRWYFNSNTQMCDQFTFTGCDEVGANNFDDEYSCRSMCNAQEINPCVLPDDIGSGEMYELYYYYNSEKKYCQGFYYGGMDGNANRFKSIDECEMVCMLSKEEQKYLSRLPQKCLYPSDKGTACDQVATMYHYEAKTNECYAFDYTGCGKEYSNRFETLQNCIDTCNITEYLKNLTFTQQDLSDLNDCEQSPIEVKHCDKGIQRWYFDSKDSKICKSFRSCDGYSATNRNIFSTQSNCLEKCEVKKRKEICHSQKSTGPCLFHQKKWFFNSSSKKCETFSYGGCLGNENRFNTQSDCEGYCAEYTMSLTTSSTSTSTKLSKYTYAHINIIDEEGDEDEEQDYDDVKDCQLPLNCNLKCSIGLVTDLKGCVICECIDPCLATTCPFGLHCIQEGSDARCINTSYVSISTSTSAIDLNDSKIINEMDSTELFEGSTAVVPCDVPSYLQPKQVLWFKNNHQIEFSPLNPRIIKAPNNSLVIFNVTDKDDATYICKLVFDDQDTKESVTKETELIINEPLEIVFTPEDREFSLNSEATLFCNLKGNAKIERIKWFRKNKLIKNEKKYELVGPSLTIKSLEISDFGAYTCEIVTQHGSVTDVAKIKIKELKLDCSDMISYLNCKVIVAKKMCSKYGEYCCRSCREAGYDVKMEKKRF